MAVAERHASGGRGTGAGDVSVSTAEKFLDESGMTPTVPTVTVTSTTGVAAIQNQTGITANCSAPGADAHSTYAWTLTNGAITAGWGTANITFTVGQRHSGHLVLPGHQQPEYSQRGAALPSR